MCFLDQFLFQFKKKILIGSIRKFLLSELLLKKQDFPKSISLDAQFFRNLRLYLEYHKIHPDMPVQDIQQRLSIDPNKTGIEYEDIMVCAQKACSGAAAAAREAFGERIEDLVAFLEFIQAKDPLFAKKVRKLTSYLFANVCILLKSLSYPCMSHQVCYLKGTNKISAIFSMTGYQRAKLANFGDVLIFDCKRSGITTLEWPKPIRKESCVKHALGWFVWRTMTCNYIWFEVVAQFQITRKEEKKEGKKKRRGGGEG